MCKTQLSIRFFHVLGLYPFVFPMISRLYIECWQLIWLKEKPIARLVQTVLAGQIGREQPAKRKAA